MVGAFGLPARALVKEHRRPVPIVLDRSQFQGPCDPAASGTTCAFWYGNGVFAVGDANWSFLELDTWGQRKLRPCTHAGYGVMSGYVANGYPDRLALHERRPTYACSTTGAATVYWPSLIDLMNADRARFFPVNDCDTQVSITGDLVPCGTGVPEKFSIVGFVRFKIVGVYKGNDPLAIGTPGPPPTPGYCGIRASDPNAVCLMMQVP
jgi:hypothetical protein